MEIITEQNNLYDIWQKVKNGIRLTKEDGLRLFASKDLLEIGYMANFVREKKHKDNAFFIVNRHINHTNICVTRCKLCAFGVDKEDITSYTMTLEEIEKRAKESMKANITELHIVGGLNPELSLEFYEEMLQRLSKIMPTVHLQAFTAVEIHYYAQENQLTIAEVLSRLKNAGLGSLPGGGAEVFAKRVRDKICPEKISGEQWLEVHRTAHQLGMRSNATLLYGHVETYEERVDHFIKLRELQDETGGFLTFIPLAFHPKNTELSGELVGLSRTTGIEDLKMLAISRLMLDNFDHIKAFWIMVGPKIAQISLRFGVDDIDGTIIEERITHAAGGETEQGLSKADIVKMIKDAGRKPIERDTLYNIVNQEF
ncbi:aminofutalosine synthase MqnE [Desulfuribacillus stibiiarsenatis]|uniref:Aminodeoxyfutalosine synthase n=1 Tax=Desulfuribacillus stibiiarsenatis TaxID=1390249 RepID=A0A1E5L778_9FIRM|nr:aminofutalosine synthase MqnE [Desulfuribacillus stibiiarsenatis]OEH85908.1 aminofutalosine synthase MqnE [Desulfuribacillus stibiiarsenatis]